MQANRSEKNTNGMSGRSPSGKKRGFSLNIGTIIFGILFIYILISVFLYMTATHVRSYQVISGPLAKNQNYTGIAVYTEKIVTADAAGYVNYYARDNSRIRKGGVVYGISPENVRRASAAPDADTLQKIREQMEEFSLGFDSEDFHDVYSLKYLVEGDILNSSIAASPGMFYGSMTIGSETVNTSYTDGIICYESDGYENFDLRTVNAQSFNEKSYRMISLKTDERVAAGDPVYRMIESEDWSLLIPLTPRQIVRLSDISRIRVKFLKDGVTQTAGFTILTSSDGSYYGKLDFQSGLVRYLDNRFIDIELVTNTEVGLKIPVSSIVTKKFFTVPEAYAVSSEDGNEVGFLVMKTDRQGKTTTVFTTTTLYEHKGGKYYIDSTVIHEGDIIVRDGSTTERYIIRDTDDLEGVYSMNKGYAVFRKVSILDKNENYCIVEKGTPYGIAQFDNIVQNASSVRESQITAKS